MLMPKGISRKVKIRSAFNSLFEMPGLIMAAVALMALAFNSLFEMQPLEDGRIAEVYRFFQFSI